MRYIYLSLLICLVVACSDESNHLEQIENPPLYEVEKDTLYFDAEASTQTLKLKACDNWKIDMDESGKDWCHVSPEVGTDYNDKLDVSVSKNGSSNRSTVFRLCHTEYPEVTELVSVVVYQKQKNVIVLAQEQYKFDNNEHLLELKLKSNVKIKTHIDADWIVPITDSKSREIKEKSLLFKIHKNENEMDRKSYITFSGEDQQQKVCVIQGEMVDSLQVLILHQEKEFVAPRLIGPDVKGIIDWGDGGTTDLRDAAMPHQYSKQGHQKVKIDGAYAESFKIDTLKSIYSITIAYERNMNDITEDFENENQKWD